ncbi:MAG TPA: glucose-1-phosphate adenylyltransferase [Thermotogota bacterium]|nr:glucose-1-phosphate adenylyltransferase [Thermotogota bacterium]HRW91635.1 glucose-1-phosphate adenylyltransferase [Thermotogota bacterium]
MILAGGQGTRLGVLTEHIAKPAVPFGGKYRIIDFSLSNCVNSGIYKVGVLTQYKPHVLNAHIGIGRPWDLDRMGGGVTILQPYTYETGNVWFRGTADAIYENLDFVDKMGPKYVVILSGDHIYAMDYMDMLNFHLSKRAQATCACMNVPLSETKRFGIMVTDLERKIVEFQEKPEEAKGTLASLGIYIFNWDFLRNRLVEDASDESSSHDFGHDIIPKIVSESGALYAYEFEGYWRDVGTLQSYWETNLELTYSIPPLNLYNPSWRFYTRTQEMPPAFFGPEAVVTNSLISEGCEIYGVVENSVLFQGVKVAPGAIVRNSVLLTGTQLLEGSEVQQTISAEAAQIGAGSRIGLGNFAENREDPKVYESPITVLGYNAQIPENVMIGKNCVIHSDVRPEHFPESSVPSGSSISK